MSNVWVWMSLGLAETYNSKNRNGLNASKERPLFVPKKEMNQVGLAHGLTSIHKIWHREKVLMDEFGKLLFWDTEEVSARI